MRRPWAIPEVLTLGLSGTQTQAKGYKTTRRAFWKPGLAPTAPPACFSCLRALAAASVYHFTTNSHVGKLRQRAQVIFSGSLSHWVVGLRFTLTSKVPSCMRHGGPCYGRLQRQAPPTMAPLLLEACPGPSQGCQLHRTLNSQLQEDPLSSLPREFSKQMT